MAQQAIERLQGGAVQRGSRANGRRRTSRLGTSWITNIDDALVTLVTGALPPRLDDEGRW